MKMTEKMIVYIDTDRWMEILKMAIDEDTSPNDVINSAVSFYDKKLKEKETSGDPLDADLDEDWTRF